MEFVALDVETANASLSSICQIGVAHFRDGEIAAEWSTLIDPESPFASMNISVHRIDDAMVRGAPKFPVVASDLRKYLSGRTVVTHTAFDRTSIYQACAKHGVATFECDWLDSAQIARRAWSEFALSGYGLANVCKKIGFCFRHHDALEDAKAAGQIVLAACRETGLDLNAWRERTKLPIDPLTGGNGKSVKRAGNPVGPLFGEVIVFTGALQIARAQAADLASRAGCDVAQSVTKKTTLLCVGDQDIERLAGQDKSSKHRKAEELISSGQQIRIIQESDFIKMVGLSA